MKNETRETDGRYSYGMERMCRCGHTMGCHLGSGPASQRACIAHELDDGPLEACGCEGFRLKRGKQ